MFLLSGNSNITFEDILKHPNINWNNVGMSKNKNITYNIVKSNPTIIWDYNKLSANQSITFEDVMNSLDKPWNFTDLSYNPNITWDMIKYTPEFQWDYELLCCNPNLTFDIIEDNRDIPWSYDILGMTSIITWDIINNNLDKGWNFNNVLKNPTIKWNDALEINNYYIQNIDILRNRIYMDVDETSILYEYFENPNVMPNISELLDLVPNMHNIRCFASNDLLYHSYYNSPQYKRAESKKRHDIIYCELIKKSCTPARLYQWNENALEINNWMNSLGFR